MELLELELPELELPQLEPPEREPREEDEDDELMVELEVRKEKKSSSNTLKTGG